jgi:hypothetical protein
MMNEKLSARQNRNESWSGKELLSKKKLDDTSSASDKKLNTKSESVLPLNKQNARHKSKPLSESGRTMQRN